MSILGKGKEPFVLTFIDEETIEQINNNKHIMIPETVRDELSIDFTEMLQRQWAVEPDEVIFNSKTKMETERAKNIAKTAVNFNASAENGGLVSHRGKNKEIVKSKIKLFDIETIFDNPVPQEDIDQFLSSPWFQMLIRFFVILYIVGLILIDYSFRQQSQTPLHSSSSPSIPSSPTSPSSSNSSSSSYSSSSNSSGTHSSNTSYSSSQSQSHSDQMLLSNILSLHFQLLANCAFTLQIILKMFSKQKFFEQPWNIPLFVGSIACWICLFLDMQEYDQYGLYHFFFFVKIMLALRIIQVFQFIRNPFQSFIHTIPQLSKIFFPYLIFTALYAILGLILFVGANQYKCRATPEPDHYGNWPQVSSNLCGASAFQCKSGYCGNPYNYGLPYNTTQRYQLGNQYGLVSFDNIGQSFLVIYHYVFLSNWSGIMFKFSKFINPYMTTLYFFTMALFLFFIMSNLNMITMCKSYIQKQKQRQKFVAKQNNQHQHQQQFQIQQHVRNQLALVYHGLQYVDIVLVVFTSIVILVQYQGMTVGVRSVLNYIDFWGTLACLIVIASKTLIMRKNILKDKFMVLDWAVIMLSVADIIACAARKQDIFNSHSSESSVLRGLKIIRILKILYFSNNWFTFEKTILRMFVQTLDTVKFFFVLLMSIVLILAMVGQNIFAYRAKFDHTTHLLDMSHGTPFVANFQSLYKAMISVVFLLQNQRWTETMYNYYIAVGPVAIAYFTIVVFVIHLLLTRLFLAIFLCYFRRNLEKKSQIQQKLKQQAKRDLCSCENVSSKNCGQIVQFLQVKSQGPQVWSEKPVKQPTEHESKKHSQQKHFWVFNRNHCVFQLIRACYSSQLFHRLTIGMIIFHCLTVILRTKLDSPDKIRVLNILQLVPLVFYVFEVAIGVFGLGLYWGNNKTYLKQSKINYVNIVVVIIVIVSQFGFLNQMQASILRRFAILKILALFTRTNKQTSIVLDSISAISQSFIRMIIIYIFLLIISCLIPLKLERNRLSSCYNLPGTHNTVTDYHQCMLYGGDWVRSPQEFSNIFESIALMYQIVTAESWMSYIEAFNSNQPWDLFFVVNFFVYNLCLLNIFVGLTVQTYLSLKDSAYKLNLLRPSQRMWLLIRNCINELIPVPIMKQPESNSKFRKLAFKIISQQIYDNFIDVLPYINALIYTLKFYRADPAYLSNLNLLQVIILIIFMLDTFLKLQLGWNFLHLDNSKIELAGFIYHIIWAILVLTLTHDQQIGRILQFGSALLLILRCKKLLFRFTWSKTLLNSVIDVLPKCVIIGALLAVILFFYISIGMQLFKHTKSTTKSDGYTTGFDNALTSLLTLLKIVSNQSWFEQVSAYVRNTSPIDICFPIHSMQDAQQHKFLGCGSPAAYLYFISFHMIIALLVMNLLIATMVAAYDQNYQKQYKSVNIFQLQDCLKLWQKYDPDGTGVIAYKKFWRLSSEIAILFGISKKKLIKSKQKFLQQLDIEVFQSVQPKQSSVLCYKFHDVLTQFSKIKLTVSKTDNEENNQYADFQIHPIVEREIKDYITKTPPMYEKIKPYKNFKSGQMKYFFGLLRKLRAWKIVAKKKDSSVISKLSHIIKVALEKKQKEEVELTLIRDSLTSFMRTLNQ